ncbi:MAG: threonine synthase [Erysipelotrichaceae bacterium]|nr:threonine synthase [Erysipelotrichaceae bacterium]
MEYVSSINSNKRVDAAQAIIDGLSPDGGLYTPLFEYKFNLDELKDLSYQELSYAIISHFFADLDLEQLKKDIYEAYDEKFDDPEITPLTKLNDSYLLELFHGQTYAFKDLALSLLPKLLLNAYGKKNYHKDIAILTATSGDTGKAALESFKDVRHTSITVLYPEDGVSPIQKKQMATSKGNNVYVLAIKGNFDDCQRIVKQAYVSERIRNECSDLILSSANSINIGRLIPQIVYYYKAYFDLVHKGKIKLNDEVNFVVPTGNFGDILAAYLGKMSGLPVKRLICASNSNNVLTDFINTGIYDINREFYTTISPSMDILVSSNLERLLYLLCQDSSYVKKLMDDLKKNRRYEVNEKLLAMIKESFSAYYANEEECLKTIKETFEKDNVMIDPHTAVALNSCRQYKAATADETALIVLSTASPFKFAKDVLKAFNIKEEDPMKAMKMLSEMCHKEIPHNLAVLDEMEVRFNESVEISEGMDKIIRHLKEVANV